MKFPARSNKKLCKFHSQVYAICEINVSLLLFSPTSINTHGKSSFIRRTVQRLSLAAIKKCLNINVRTALSGSMMFHCDIVC